LQDEKFMMKCIELAQKGELYTAPNPMVGCVVVYNDEIVAEGYHQRYGEAHAEVNAFAALHESIDVSKCTVYVNLEPCSHYGKTPPCADLIITKKPQRVVIGMLDPHEKVAGKGIKKLLEAGIDLSVGILEEECKALNKRFIKAHTQQLPYVTLKWAETKDGYMASQKGQVKISAPENDAFVHYLRATHQALLVGANTVNTDNPLLDVRHREGGNPTKVIYSPKLSVSRDALLFESGKTIVYNTLTDEESDKTSLVNIANGGIKAMLADLYSKGIHSVLVEGGPTLLQGFLDEKLWDEAIVIKSSNIWVDGIKAPWVGIPSYKEVQQYSDLIKYFKPYK
jgi:diaminohydroxyphosphoribosylaminopyrimidine deaminase / 5-amino-6-(5-phosphoribosylamino)uracil reductase